MHKKIIHLEDNIRTIIQFKDLNGKTETGFLPLYKNYDNDKLYEKIAEGKDGSDSSFEYVIYKKLYDSKEWRILSKEEFLENFAEYKEPI